MPWGIAAGAAIGIGSAVGGAASGAGKNEAKTKSFGESGQHDPNSFQYGGREGGAADASKEYGMMAGAADSRKLDYGQADNYASRGLEARNQSEQAARLMMARARGETPSVAGMQANADAQRLMAQQSSQGASARGAAGLAMASQSAMSNTANGMGQISQQAQISAAQERLAAEQGAFGAYAGLRGQDLESQKQAAQQLQFQISANDQKMMGLLAGQRDVNQQQLTARMQRQQILAGSWDSAQGLYQQRMQGNANNARKNMEAIGSSASGAASGAAGAMGGGGGGK